MSVRKWDGAARRSVDWDGLRRVSYHQFCVVELPAYNYVRIPSYGTTMATVLSICMSKASPEEDQRSRFPWTPFFKQTAAHFWTDS
jgi:hypothetical protein